MSSFLLAQLPPQLLARRPATIFAFLALGLMPTAAFAQNVTPRTNPPSEDQAVELNPFVVSSTTDTGYLASNTLAGSRMNTELRNVASVVSVFTPEFMSDL